ncbi:MAG TPA: 2-hydroxy-3-oxopropionate reductase, partial [Gammaproteobacteria bacterium]|nr:2-hydroxy-3-oxopropionate reductase [Gammaproteobacteria bacterium]
MEKLGFIGVGMMGKPMAKNLLKAGYELTVLDLNSAAVDELVSQGAVRAESAAEVVGRCHTVITMLPGSAEVEHVVCGEGGVLSAINAEHLIVDMSTID